MVKMAGKYTGEKHCQLTHGPSGLEISTDAPVDNHGKGESFSPTDLLSVSLGACMTTVMAIQAEKEGISLKGLRFEVRKEMTSQAPRKVEKIAVELWMPEGITESWQLKLIQIAETCPVKLSLHPDVKIELHFHWQ